MSETIKVVPMHINFGRFDDTDGCQVLMSNGMKFYSDDTVDVARRLYHYGLTVNEAKCAAMYIENKTTTEDGISDPFKFTVEQVMENNAELLMEYNDYYEPNAF